MAEKVKKAKAPAKPRTSAAPAKKTTAKKAAVGKPAAAKTPSREDIAQLAHRYLWSAAGRMVRTGRTGCGPNES